MNATSLPAARAYIGFGANLGNPAAALSHALEALGKLPDTRVAAHSSCYRSAPIGVAESHPDYTNAVIALDTALSPQKLLDALLSIEAAYGRCRNAHLAPRTIDLDLLLHGTTTMQTATLVLPHPRLHQRAFVLLPLAEIAPEIVIPGLGPLPPLLENVKNQRITRVRKPSQNP